MTETPFEFHFPRDVQLGNDPLLEAWLEIRWRLEPLGSSDAPQLFKDPGYPFALGAFFAGIKERFPYREDLDASRAPEDMLPYIVRHRFRVAQDAWPVVQLGPGVVTVNFTKPYTWHRFKETALFVCGNLLAAYDDAQLETQMVALRYRNGEAFDYGSNNLLDFVSESLNTSIRLPKHIPGSVSSTPWPISANVRLTYELLQPRGTGILQFATGTDRVKDEKLVLWQLEMIARDEDAPELYPENLFEDWLTAAHAAIHEWFFSTIQGPLLEKYKREGE